MKKRSLNLRSPILLFFCAVAGMAPSSRAASGTWNQTAAGTAYNWNDAANWLPNTGFPSGIDDEGNVNINIVGAQTISLNAPITLGTLRLGDFGTAGFFAQTLNAGNGGSLTFDTSTGNAQLFRSTSVNVPPVNPNLTDIINAPVTLNDNLTVTYPWVNSGNGFRIDGVVGGTGSITMIGTNYPDTGAGMVQVLDLTNPANSFTGGVEVANGALVFRGNVGLSANSALGNSAGPVVIGSVSSVVGDESPSLQNTTTAELRLQALDDTSNYEFARGIDFSQNLGTAAGNGRARFTLTANNAGAPNTNALTVSGNVTLPSGNRGAEFLVVRQGQTMRFTGAIDSAPGGSGTIFWGPQGPGLSTTDGRNNGTYRFADVARNYNQTQNLTAGTVVIEGNVGPVAAPSPVGLTAFTLGDGNGGNFISANTEGANRRLFMEMGGTNFERTLSPGAGSGFNLAGTANVNSVTPAVFQALYGNSGSINLLNGYEFGGLNTTGAVVFTANLAAGNVNVSSSGTAGGTGGTNPVSVVHNIALSSVAGGLVEFRGNITGSTVPSLGDTATPAGIVTGNNARITINQFRNHPNLDTNLDGLPDANADKTVGTPLGGTVVLSGNNTYGGSTEVLGGTLRLDYSLFDASKLSDSAPLILSGGTVEVSGGTHSEFVSATVLSANTGSTITSANAPAPLTLNLITAQNGGAVNFTAENIATTDTLNTNGILGPWATINATDFATNSTNAEDGPITAYTAYTNLTRKSSGTKLIPNNPAANVRIIEGTGAAADITLAAAVTTINTLNQSSNGGATAAVINTPGQTLAVNTILAAGGTGGLTIGAGVLQPAVSGGALIIQNASANPVRVSSVIANHTSASALNLLNTGTVILTAANTYTGTTGISGGILQLGDGVTDGSLVSAAITNNGALIHRLLGDQTYPGVISGTGSLTKDGPGKLILTGANTGSGAVTITAGTLQLGDGGAAGSIAAGSVLTNHGILGVNRSSTATQGIEFPALITGTGAVVKEGTGLLTLNAANTYQGTTTVTTGVVAVSHATALGTVAGETLINANGTLTTGGRVSLSNSITLAENFTIDGAGDGSPPTPSYNGAITASSGNNTITGTITLNGTVTYRLTSNNNGTVMNYGLIQRAGGSTGNLTLDPSAGATLTVNQPLDLNGGALTCHAGGLVILNAAANDIGNTVVQNGTSLRIGASDALAMDRNLQIGQGAGNGAAGVNNDVGTFDLAGKNQTVNSLNGYPNAGAAVPNNATASSRRLITSSQPGTSVLTIGSTGGSGSFDGLIQNGSGIVAITKTGTGTQTLTGPNTYTGDTTVNGGTLALGAATNLADTSTVRIDNTLSILQLADGVTDTVAALFIDGVAKTGTWGSSLSAAANKDDEHFAGTGILTVSGGADAYTTWAVSFGLQNPWLGADPKLDGTPPADPDGDGRSNRYEYLFGLIPTSGASASEITIPLGQATGTFTYSRRQPGLTGATFRYQWSTTLSGPWADFTPVSTVSNNAAPVEFITVGVPAPLLTNTRLFVRVITP